jgi:hypothetical protein
MEYFLTRSDQAFSVRSCAVQLARVNQVRETVFQGAVTFDIGRAGSFGSPVRTKLPGPVQPQA